VGGGPSAWRRAGGTAATDREEENRREGAVGEWSRC
jgi:hypothetical protein